MISSQFAESFRNLLCNTVHAFTTSSAVLRFTANGVLKTLKREDMISKHFLRFFWLNNWIFASLVSADVYVTVSLNYPWEEVVSLTKTWLWFFRSRKRFTGWKI